MGERSKKIGEIGEDIVGNFFKLIGWDEAIKGSPLKCKKPQKHARAEAKSGKRNEHGIDYLFCYKSPLEGSTVESAVISVKFSSDPYENNPKAKFRSHAEDLVQTLECYRHSEIKRQQQELFERVKKSRETGVLFWLSGSDDTYDDVVSRISNTRLDPEYVFDSFHVVDNMRIGFVFDVLTFLRSKVPLDKINFYYPETSLSYVDTSIPRSGKVLPIEFLTSPVLPFLIKSQSSEGQDTFCLASRDRFDSDSIRRLLKAAREYTQEMSCKYLFLFPNYVTSEHEEAVIKAATGLGESLISRVEVASFTPDFRSLSNAV